MSALYPIAHLLLALLELILLGWAVRLWLRSKSVAMIVLPIVLASISYDNFVLAIGNLIGRGELLKTLNMLRFLVHYLAVPLFIVISVELAHRAGAKWANTIARTLSWLLAALLAGIDILTRFTTLDLVPVDLFGVLRYANSHAGGLPIFTIIANLVTIGIGIELWYRIKWRWLFWGGIIALIGNAIPSSIVGTIVGAISEFIIALCLLLSERYTQALTLEPPRRYPIKE